MGALPVGGEVHMKIRVVVVALCIGVAGLPLAAGGLVQSEVRSDAFVVEPSGTAVGALGGTGTLAVIAALVLLAAVAGGGDSTKAPASAAPPPAPVK